MRVRVHLELVEQLGQAWVRDGISGSDLKQEEIRETMEPVVTQDILSRQVTDVTEKLNAFGIDCHLPARHRSPEMRGAGHITKHGGAWGSRPACLFRRLLIKLVLLIQLSAERAVCSGSLLFPVRRTLGLVCNMRSETIRITCNTIKYGQRGVVIDEEKLGHNVMRSFSLDSGAVWEILQAFEVNMAALTVLPQYGWVLITFILSVFV